MKILITGSSGFIGNKIFSTLDCCSKGLYPYDIKTGDDIRDRLKLEKVFETENFNVVVHCAALTGVRRGEIYPEEYISTNVMGTKNVVDMCEKYNVHHLINFSSSSVYGQVGCEPIKEEEEKVPRSIYGMTKLMAEHICTRANLKVTTIRPFTVFGDYGRKDQVVQKWIDRIKQGKPITFYGDGSTGRGYTYLDDLVDGVSMLIDKGENDPIFSSIMKRAYNMGGDLFVTLAELYDIFHEVIPDIKRVDLPLPEGDNLYNFADTTLVLDEIGWKPKCDFEDTLRKIIKQQLDEKKL